MSDSYLYPRDAIIEAKEAGAAEERAKIVAYLRSKDTYDFDDLAIDIEAGEHVTKGGAE